MSRLQGTHCHIEYIPEVAHGIKHKDRDRRHDEIPQCIHECQHLCRKEGYERNRRKCVVSGCEYYKTLAEYYYEKHPDKKPAKTVSVKKKKHKKK